MNTIVFSGTLMLILEIPSCPWKIEVMTQPLNKDGPVLSLCGRMMIVVMLGV